MSVEKNIYHQVVEDNKIWRKDLLVMYLFNCLITDQDIIIDFRLEGSCCHANKLYSILDTFCSKTKFPANRITIKTANLIEKHDVYNIVKVPEYWYEVSEIQKWLNGKNINSEPDLKYYFGNFIGRSTWYRIWIASLLYSKYKEKTSQTFNSGIRSRYIVKNDGAYDYLGLEDLVKYECDILPEVIEFLETCPISIPDDISYIKTVKPYIPQNEYYPIQHPANLNILQLYPNIFVDVVCETRITGNIFFVTEKFWRCVVARRPFIVVGSQYFLRNIKRLGFKTFNDFWDEGYDEYPSKQRINEIAKLLDNISQYSLHELEFKLTEMQDILNHNYNTFMNLTYDQIGEVFNDV